MQIAMNTEALDHLLGVSNSLWTTWAAPLLVYLVMRRMVVSLRPALADGVAKTTKCQGSVLP